MGRADRLLRRQGFLAEHPVEFVVPRECRFRLYQGHHRIRAALELGIAAVPVQFWFAHLPRLGK